MIPYEPDPLHEEGVASAVHRANHAASSNEVRAAWQETRARIEHTFVLPSTTGREVFRVPTATRHPERGWLSTGWRATIGVACATLVIVGGRWALHGRSHTTEVSTAGHQYATAAGQRQVVTLRDGTRVTLAPQSVLTVGRDFGATSRTVQLSGQAYFEVRTAQGTPFIVHSGTLNTRVLGTAFMIRRYVTDSVAQVAVLSGRVSTGGARGSVTLSAGRAARLTDSTVALTDDAHALTDWTRGELVFKDVPVRHMLTEVGRWYGYDFKLVDTTLATRHVSVTFDMSDPDDMMLVLKSALHVSMAFDGKTVTLAPRHTPAERKTRPLELSTPSSEKGR